ncbi:hypothetical protein F4803DRAFT_567088 [Xylaria telfairii]|nr:hypothetical protein F4803DRAFT_567088 [Xylaria telfairii]
MAMSIEDSLYISGCVIDDPSIFRQNNRIYKVLGNIGKPGVSLLIPPADPVVRESRSDEWNLINHLDYDGKAKDSFYDTSLHLSLTDYRVPYVTVVSVYDRGNWVGDVDIMRVLKSASMQGKCKHRSKTYWFGSAPKITCVDSWYELPDPPRNPAVVRSYGNCFGRLATTALSAQLGFTTLVLPEQPCKDYRCYDALY